MENSKEVKFEQKEPILSTPEQLSPEKMKDNFASEKTIETIAQLADGNAEQLANPIMPPNMGEASVASDGIDISYQDFKDAMREENVSRKKELGEKTIRAVMEDQRKCGDDMHKLATMVQDDSDTAIYELFGRIRDNSEIK